MEMYRRHSESLGDGRLRFAPAERNKEAILAVLRRVLPSSGTVLEIASGTGQHAAHFARALPDLVWQPSDADAELRESIARWVAAEALANLRSPLALDARRLPWPIASADALVCSNMIHIAPWSATPALFRGAAAVLSPGAPLILYGPYRRGRDTEPSNLAFDAQLRSQDPAWGLRELADVEAAGTAKGFQLEETVAMPANNLIAVFRAPR